jgi:uncharacterized cupin superfamily protein
MTAPRFTCFEPYGPAETGLQVWDPIDPATLSSGAPVQRGHVYHEDASTGLMAGVWDCTAMTGKFEPYEVNEFMLLLEGSLTIVGGNGDEVIVSAGEAFVLPKGLPCTWKQDGYLRKFFMIFDDMSGRAPDDPSALRVILPQPAGPAGGMTELESPDATIGRGGVPTQHDHVYFEDMTGQMTVGLWYSTAFEHAVAPFPCDELMCFLEGSAILTDGDGVAHEFHAGDTVFIPKGAPIGWKNTESVRHFYATFEPGCGGIARNAG